MTTLQEAETALNEARGKLTRLNLGKLEEANAYRAALNEARATAYMHPNDVKAAERAERLEIAETEARWAAPILDFAANIASDIAIALLGDGLDAHGAAKAADTLEGYIAEMAAEVDSFTNAARIEGFATDRAALKGQASSRILAVQILGKAAQAMRAAVETAEADEADDEAGEVPAWLIAQRAYLEDEAAEFKRYAAACKRQGVTVEREHSYRDDGLLVALWYTYTGKGGKVVAWCTVGSISVGRDNARVYRPNGPAITFKYPERAKAKALAIAAGLEA